jgi:hypothetical protein
VQEDGCIVASLPTVAERLAFAGLGEDLRPLSLASRVVDAGNDSYWSDPDLRTSSFVDLDGSQRIYNGTIDVGCWEYDWRGEFSRVLGSRSSFSVVSASPAVTADGADVVRLSGDGSTLDVRWTDAGNCTKRYSFAAGVTGTGTLAVYRDGAVEPWATLTAEAGQAVFVFDSAAAVNELSFVFSGEGFAELSSFAKHKGTVITIR